MGVRMRIAMAGVVLAVVGSSAILAEVPPPDMLEKIPAATASAPARRANPQERADVGVVRGGANPDKNWAGKHEKFVEKAKKGGVEIYFEGDSITEQWLGPGKSVWEKEYAGMKAESFGIGGDRTQHVIYRLENGELDGVDPKLFVLMIGTNNVGSYRPEDTAEGVKKIVSIMREKKPNAKILLLAIFPRGETAKDGFRRKNDAVNEIISKLDDGKMIKYLDIGAKFLDKDGNLSKEISPDLLHFNDKGYQIWADAVREPIKEMLK